MKYDLARDHDNVRSAIDDCLSGVDAMPSLRSDIMRKVRGEIKVKKKLSVGFVLTMILVLITVTALAITAIQALNQKAIQQQAESGLVREWSADEKIEFIDAMAEAGLDLDDTQVQSLHSDALSEEEKDTLAMQIMIAYYPSVDSVLTATDILSSEYGRYGTWPLELQAWYSEMLEENGGNAYPVNVLLENGDLPEEDALVIAKGLLTEVYNYSQEEADSMLVERYLQEKMFETDDGERYLEKCWEFRFFPDPDLNLFIFESIRMDGMTFDGGDNFPDESETATIEQLYFDLRINQQLSTVDEFASFAKNEAPIINDAIARGLDINKWPRYFASIPYALPGDADITQEEALQIADAAMLAHMGWTYAEVYDTYLPSVSYRIYDENNPEWRFGYRMPVGTEGYENAFERFHAGELPFCITVRIQAQTGEVFEVSESYEMGLNRFGE